jgi:hypothetical protein
MRSAAPSYHHAQSAVQSAEGVGITTEAWQGRERREGRLPTRKSPRMQKKLCGVIFFYSSELDRSQYVFSACWQPSVLFDWLSCIEIDLSERTQLLNKTLHEAQLFSPSTKQ